MDSILVRSNGPLKGKIPISGAKNAALPLMIASLLTQKTLTLENVPHLVDVELLIRILSNHGVDYSVNGKRPDQDSYCGRTIHFTASNIVDTTASYNFVSKMRASFWVIGPLLARMGYARVALPGGCAIGTRPVNIFLESLKKFGAELEMDRGYVVARIKSQPVGTKLCFSKVSVGATHVAIMVATLAKGETLIENAACEPEIIDLAKCLNAMGAKISGAGTPTIVIQGVDVLHSASHKVLPDRIEAGTFAIASIITGGDVILTGIQENLLQSVINTLKATGALINIRNDGIQVANDNSEITPVDIMTTPFPGFPTDLQAQFMALMTCTKGTSRIVETIFENRFMHVQELIRLGADISLNSQIATVKGVKYLQGAQVMATDLRASVSLIIAGLIARGQTKIGRIYHLDRGFERLEEKLHNCGADIERVKS